MTSGDRQIEPDEDVRTIDDQCPEHRVVGRVGDPPVALERGEHTLA